MWMTVTVFCVCIVYSRNLKKVSLILESSSLEHFHVCYLKVVCLTVRFMFRTLSATPFLKKWWHKIAANSEEDPDCIMYIPTYSYLP